MKNLILALGVILVFSCTKTDKGTTTLPTSNQEESIKFITNLDTGTYNVADTLPLVITVSSKIPTSGIVYSILVNWTDSSKQIYKLDSSSTSSSLNLNIVGLKKSGNYSLSISVTSKSTSTNTSNKTIGVVNNPLGRFMGYKVASNAKQIGGQYWSNTNLLPDLITAIFQKPYDGRIKYGTFFTALSCGDFNNDGWIDVFNAGANFNGIQAPFAFLIWNPQIKTFEEKNLFNDKTFKSFGGNKNTIRPYYLNDDNFVDLVIFDNGDEGIANSTDEPIRFVLSDGNGGYDLKSIETSEKEYPVWKKEHGDIGDLNEDGIPDLVLVANQFVYIYWGIKNFPFFTTTGHATFVGDLNNFGSKANNGFGEIVSDVAGMAYTAKIIDINKDNKNDILIGTAETHNDIYAYGKSQQQRILINQGKGRFNNNGIVKLPFNYSNDNITTSIQDCITDDLNNDGLLDVVAMTSQNNTINNYTWAPWDILIYIQQKDGSFIIDRTYVEYSINKTRKGNWKKGLIYCDFNSDGIKDLSYIDDADNGELKYKSVFIRNGKQFIEQDFFLFDPYANSIKGLIK